VKRIISLDPGAVTGYAVFEDKVLVSAGYVQLSKGQRPPPQEPGTGLVIEIPRVYPGARQEAPPNDLIRLALRAGWLQGVYNALLQEEVYPADWKGQLPKDICHARILTLLSKDELQVLENTKGKRAKTLNHNMLDAVGIGLWYLQRRYKGSNASIHNY
jgi:hypothetical protein